MVVICKPGREVSPKINPAGTLILGISCLQSFKKINFFFNKFTYFFIFGCVGSLLLRAGFLQLRQAGATLCCSAWASHCGGFSCCGARVLGARTSVVVARGLSSCGSWALELRLSSCGARAQLLRSRWDLPRPGLEPVSPALAGRFLTTAPPGKPLNICCLRHPVCAILLWQPEQTNTTTIFLS